MPSGILPEAGHDQKRLNLHTHRFIQQLNIYEYLLYARGTECLKQYSKD